MNPTELIPSYYNFLAQFAEFIFYKDYWADETYFFEIVRCYEYRRLVDVSNAYYVIKLEIEYALFTNYCFLIMLIPQNGQTQQVLKNVYAVINFLI
jgi:hypothetical protein